MWPWPMPWSKDRNYFHLSEQGTFTMKFTLLVTMLFALLSSSLMADEVSVECTAPDFIQHNRFSLEATFEFDEENGTIEERNVSFTATIRGNDKVTQEVEATVSGQIRFFDDQDLTKYPFANIKLVSADKKTFINLNPDFPGKLSSKIRTTTGMVFRSQCFIK